MDKQLRSFLNKLTIKDKEIDELINKYSALEYADYKNAVECVKAVVNAGIAIMDISFLIYINPLFMLNDPKDLTNTLNAIDGDIEEALKNDPFII